MNIKTVFFNSGEMTFKYTCAILLLNVFLLSTKAKQLKNNSSHPAKGNVLVTIYNFSHFRLVGTPVLLVF